MRRNLRIQAIIWSVLVLSTAEAAAQTDSLYLDPTTVTATKAEAAVVSKLSGVTMDVPALNTMPSLLGSADPITYAQYLPSMSTRSELEAGIHIQGNDHQHNIVSSGGVPIYGASHLLGIFSVFNPSHYGTMRYRTRTPEMNRLGGSLDMVLPEKLPESVGGDFQAGLIAAQGSLAVPLGEKAGVRLSARRSYINLLYGGFLRLDDSAVRYGFTDVNLTAQWNPGPKDKLWLDAYWGSDAAACEAGFYGADVASAWQNAVAALHWRHLVGEGRLEQTLYYTEWGLGLDAVWNAMSATLKSSLGTAGYRAQLALGGWRVKAESALHNCQPQNPGIEGGTAALDNSQAPQSAVENTLMARYAHSWGPFSVEAGLKGTLYYTSARWMNALDPDLELGWNLYRGGQFALRLGTQHQYLFQTGMTDLGMPSEFWFLAGEEAAPQKAVGGSIAYMLDMFQGAYRLSAEAYYKTLEGQVEYKGIIMEFMNTAYSLDKVLLHGNGRAYGVNLSLNKVSGALTGWISYAWGRSLRSFDSGREYPSSHERVHELDAVASYRLGPWTFGASLVAASGTPYTAPENLYYMAGCIVASYGEHNASRLKPYFRTDVSVNYFFNRGAVENGINLSVYNVTGAENELYCTLMMDREAGTYRYKGTGLQIRFMPSVSYFHKF